MLPARRPHRYTYDDYVAVELLSTLPLSARFPKGSIFREDRLPVPAEALREVILNAVMHRDCSRA
ncbi:MAG: hypothetical protein IT371_23050, partial [Deltaproteobacteria bacterium]|nr:hypothetical protein [Deltaproteobacteria bacterium]